MSYSVNAEEIFPISQKSMCITYRMNWYVLTQHKSRTFFVRILSANKVIAIVNVK